MQHIAIDIKRSLFDMLFIKHFHQCDHIFLPGDFFDVITETYVVVACSVRTQIVYKVNQNFLFRLRREHTDYVDLITEHDTKSRIGFFRFFNHRHLFSHRLSFIFFRFLLLRYNSCNRFLDRQSLFFRGSSLCFCFFVKYMTGICYFLLFQIDTIVDKSCTG